MPTKMIQPEHPVRWLTMSSLRIIVAWVVGWLGLKLTEADEVTIQQFIEAAGGLVLLAWSLWTSYAGRKKLRDAPP